MDYNRCISAATKTAYYSSNMTMGNWWSQQPATVRSDAVITKSQARYLQDQMQLSLLFFIKSTAPLYDQKQFCQKAMCHLHLRWHKKKHSGCYIDHLTWSGVAVARPTGLIPVNPVHTILTNTNCPIDGHVEPLNANDSPLILIRETHQIQTTSQINRQVRVLGLGSYKETTTTALMPHMNCKQPRAKDLSLGWKLVRHLRSIIARKSC